MHARTHTFIVRTGTAASSPHYIRYRVQADSGLYSAAHQVNIGRVVTLGMATTASTKGQERMGPFHRQKADVHSGLKCQEFTFYLHVSGSYTDASNVDRSFIFNVEGISDIWH
jgi:hypothetical protein